MKRYYVQVIETNREKNTAYVARSYRFETHLDEVGLEDKWFNTVEDLDEIEKIFRCKFDDGEHPYVQATIFKED